MTVAAPELTAEQARAAELIDGLDLEPITYKLMFPEPGEPVMTLAAADERTAHYRCFLKLLAWYPGESIVPSKPVDKVWHEHLLDDAKWAEDSLHVFGRIVHHFPYLGLRGPDDEAIWHALYARTRDLFRLHFGIELDGSAARGCHNNGSSCKDSNGGICNNDATCERSDGGIMSQVRPRPDRSGV